MLNRAGRVTLACTFISFIPIYYMQNQLFLKAVCNSIDKTIKNFILVMGDDTTKRLMSSPKCRSVEVINNPARPGSNHREVNCINYK